MYDEIKAYKIIVYVPEENFGAFIENIQDKIPSFGGDYDRVAWWANSYTQYGIEQFRPLEGAHPVKGEKGETVRGVSIRLELHVPYEKNILRAFISETLIPAHPWEKPLISVSKAKLY